jgi:hypothetical protein
MRRNALGSPPRSWVDCWVASQAMQPGSAGELKSWYLCVLRVKENSEERGRDVRIKAGHGMYA